MVTTIATAQQPIATDTRGRMAFVLESLSKTSEVDIGKGNKPVSNPATVGSPGRKGTFIRCTAI